MTPTSVNPPNAVPTPISSGSSIFKPTKFHAPLKPVQTSSVATRKPHMRGAVRKTAPTAPNRPCFTVSFGRSGRTAIVVQTSITAPAAAYSGRASDTPLRSSNQPNARHPAAYERLSHPRIRP